MENEEGEISRLECLQIYRKPGNVIFFSQEEMWDVADVGKFLTPSIISEIISGTGSSQKWQLFSFWKAFRLVLMSLLFSSPVFFWLKDVDKWSLESQQPPGTDLGGNYKGFFNPFRS